MTQQGGIKVADEIEMANQLKQGDHPGLSRCAQCNHKAPQIEKKETER